MNNKNWMESAKEKINSLTIDKWLFVGIAGVIVILLGKSTFFQVETEKKTDAGTQQTQQTHSNPEEYDLPIDASYKQQLEMQTEDLIRKMKTVKNVQVLLMFEDNGEKILAYETNTNEEERMENGTQENERSYGVQNEVIYERNGDGDEMPYVKRTRNPVPSGAAVIVECERPDETALEISKLLQALFGLSAHKISVVNGTWR